MIQYPGKDRATLREIAKYDARTETEPDAIIGVGNSNVFALITKN